MKNIQKVSIICCIIGLAITSLGLIMGLGSYGKTGMAGLFDFLITLDKIKKGLIISWLNSIIKIGIIAFYLGIVIFRPSYLAGIDIVAIIFLAILAVPSVLNIKKLKENKKQ